MTGFAEEGGCLCGAVRLKLTAPPVMAGYCHCSSCRKHTGAPVAAYVDCVRAALSWTAGAPTEHQSSPAVWRAFCGRCGSTLYLREDGRPDQIAVHLGVFDRPERFPPEPGKDSFPEEKLPWLHLGPAQKI